MTDQVVGELLRGMNVSHPFTGFNDRFHVVFNPFVNSSKTRIDLLIMS